MKESHAVFNMRLKYKKGYTIKMFIVLMAPALTNCTPVTMTQFCGLLFKLLAISLNNNIQN